VDRAQVLTLAPDEASRRAAAGVRAWLITGATPGTIWGECGSKPYRTSIRLAGPDFACSCPSRKVPCKHALSLLLLHADGAIPAAGDTPGWVTRPGAPKGTQPDPEAARRRAELRDQRAASGMRELDQWLTDQVRQGLAGAATAGYAHWDAIAARMVDAQCPAVAERLRSLASAPYTGPGWEGRLLEELALLRLLARAHHDRDRLPEDLKATVRSRVGLTTRQADVIAGGDTVTDVWDVLGWRDTDNERIRSRRIWLRGQNTGRPALVLSFAAPGESLDTSMRPGTQIPMTLAFYPGALPLRAAVAGSEAARQATTPKGGTIAELLDGWAAALARDPWQESWPAVVTGVPALRPEPALRDEDGDTLPMRLTWELFAMSGGHPITVAAEYTPRGLHPMTAWPPGTGAAVRVQ
jgi:hypothetical protein